MNTCYHGHCLTPDFYHKWKMGIHLELGKDLYQFDENGRLNRKMFQTVYQQVSEIVPLLFKRTDDIFVVVNTYPHRTKKSFILISLKNM